MMSLWPCIVRNDPGLVREGVSSPQPRLGPWSRQSNCHRLGLTSSHWSYDYIIRKTSWATNQMRACHFRIEEEHKLDCCVMFWESRGKSPCAFVYTSCWRWTKVSIQQRAFSFRLVVDKIKFQGFNDFLLVLWRAEKTIWVDDKQIELESGVSNKARAWWNTEIFCIIASEHQNVNSKATDPFKMCLSSTLFDIDLQCD